MRVKIFWLSVCDTESLISFVAVVLLFLVVAAAAADCAHVYYVNYYVAGRARGERGEASLARDIVVLPSSVHVHVHVRVQVHVLVCLVNVQWPQNKV